MDENILISHRNKSKFAEIRMSSEVLQGMELVHDRNTQRRRGANIILRYLQPAQVADRLRTRPPCVHLRDVVFLYEYIVLEFDERALWRCPSVHPLFDVNQWPDCELSKERQYHLQCSSSFQFVGRFRAPAPDSDPDQ